MRLLITGGTGVLGRAPQPLAEAAGRGLEMPEREELDLFDPSAVAGAVRDLDGERVSTEPFSQAAEWHPQH